MTDTSDTDQAETISAEEFQAQAAKIADLEARLDKHAKSREGRPAPTQEQLRTELQALLGVKGEAVGTRDDAKSIVQHATQVADAAAAEAKTATAELRNMQILDAARTAQAVDPADIAMYLTADDDRPLSDQVAELKKTKPHLFKSKPADPDFTGGDDAKVTDKGRRDLYSEIRESRR